MIANTNAGKNVLTNIMLVHFYFKDNKNLPHLTSTALILLVLTSIAARIGHECNIWENLQL